MNSAWLFQSSISAASRQPCGSLSRRRRKSVTTGLRRRTTCWAPTSPAAPVGPSRGPIDRSVPRPVRAVRLLGRVHENRRFFHAGLDPGATSDRAGRQAGGLSRRAVGRPVPARHRSRLERNRVHRPEREFPQPRPPLGGAGRGHEGAMGRAARRFKGRWHTIEDAGINPLPTARKIPLWYGGHADVTLRRFAKWGDGWMPLAYPPGDEAKPPLPLAPLRRGGRP